MHGLSVAELGILDWIAAHLHNGFLDTVVPWITSLGNAGLFWILLGLFILLFQRGRRGVGVQVLLALLFSLILCNLLLKNGVDRIRPFALNPGVELLIPKPGDPSFPSGHTSASFAAAVVLLLNRWRGRWVTLALAVCIALSRLYLYVHFPTDVLGGALAGSLCGWLAFAVWKKWIEPKLEQRTPPKGRGPQGPPSCEIK